MPYPFGSHETRVMTAIPAVVEDFWRTFGRTPQLNYVEDTWILPEHYFKQTWPGESEYLILLIENQAVCRAGIRREDLFLPDPPVYTQMEEDDPWLLSAPTTSEFLESALLYEGVWEMEYAPEEFYWLTDEELAQFQAKLTKHPVVLKNWMGMEITCYSNRPDNLVVIMDVGDQYQTFFGAVTEESYLELMDVMEGLGEPI